MRGYLCNGCNVVEGSRHSDERPLFARYRRRHPASILNYFEAYAPNGASQVMASIEKKEESYRKRYERAKVQMETLMAELARVQPQFEERPRPRKATRKLLRRWSAGDHMWLDDVEYMIDLLTVMHLELDDVDIYDDLQDHRTLIGQLSSRARIIYSFNSMVP